MRRLGWAARIALAVLVCGCNTSYNPTPAVTGVFPNDITAGSQAFTLFLAGNNFQSNTTAQWNGVNRPVVYNDQTNQLAMTILDGDVSNPGSSGQITVTNPAPGGGLNPNAYSFPINPSAANGPVITAISPTSVTEGTNADVTLTVTANNLTATDMITFNGTEFTTTAVGSPVTGLTATIGSENFSTEELASIAVQTATPGVASPSVKLPIGPASNPVPHLSSITPSSTQTGTLPAGAYLLLAGSGFVPGSVVSFNGIPHPTGFSSSTLLAVGVLSSDVAGSGTVAVTVANPNPGGGTSSAVNFTIQ